MSNERYSITDYRITAHARWQMERRQIWEVEIAHALAKPDSVESVREGRKVFQTIVENGDPPRDYLLRVIIDLSDNPPVVITAYRTSKIDKYRGNAP